MFYVLLDNGAKINCKDMDEVEQVCSLYIFHGPVIYDATFGNRLAPVFHCKCNDSEY